MHQLTFGLRIYLKSIGPDYIRIFKISVFQAIGIRTVGKAINTRSEHYSPGVTIPVKGNFFAEFILLQYNSGRIARMIYFRKNSIIIAVTKMLSPLSLEQPLNGSIRQPLPSVVHRVIMEFFLNGTVIK